MLKKIKTGFIFILILGLLTALVPSLVSAQKQKSYKLLIHGGDILEHYFEMHKSFGDYLSKELGAPVEVLVSVDKQKTERLTQNKEIDFVYAGPWPSTFTIDFDYIAKAALAQISTLEDIPKGYTRTVIVARKDSGIKTLADLKGKTVRFGGRLNFLINHLGKKLLKDAGIDINRDLADFFEGGYPGDALLSVYNGEFDAGVTLTVALTKNDVKVEDLIILASSFDIPGWGFAVRNDLDSQTRENLKQALLKLDKSNLQHKQILDDMDMESFVEASNQEYDITHGLKEMLKEFD